MARSRKDSVGGHTRASAPTGIRGSKRLCRNKRMMRRLERRRTARQGAEEYKQWCEEEAQEAIETLIDYDALWPGGKLPDASDFGWSLADEQQSYIDDQYDPTLDWPEYDPGDVFAEESSYPYIGNKVVQLNAAERRVAELERRHGVYPELGWDLARRILYLVNMVAL